MNTLHTRIARLTVASAVALGLGASAAGALEKTATATTTLSCSGTSSYPTAIPGWVRSGSTVGCNQTVSSITVIASLAGPNGAAGGAQKTCLNARVCSVNAYAPFAPGSWYSSGAGEGTAYDGTRWTYRTWGGGWSRF